jgi:hypothetical protein
MPVMAIEWHRGWAQSLLGTILAVILWRGMPIHRPTLVIDY